MASLGSYLPSPGKVTWRLDAAQRDVAEGNKVRHVMIKSAQVWEKPTPHVMYKVEVLTEHDQWYVHRRYSQFHSLHRKLMKLHAVSRDLLPPKRYHGNLSKQLIDQRRLQLESYLQKLIHSEAVVAQSNELFQFLDVPAHSNWSSLVPRPPRYLHCACGQLKAGKAWSEEDIVKVTDILTRHLYCHGDKLLMQATPVALSVNEMYSITKRLRLPFDATGVDTTDPAADPAHLYSFLHQLKSLRVCLPPYPSSVCCMPFEMGHFKSLTTLKLDKVPLSQVLGLISLQQQLIKLTVLRSLRTIRELLIECVEERRSGGSPVLEGRTVSGFEKWRVTAMARLTENRVVVQPWHSLHTLTLSHNKITHLDDSLQILPALRELNLSHNLIQILEVPFLCIPSLEKLNLSHNAINRIASGKKVLESVRSLNLSHNRLHSLDGITSFISMTTLNLSYNLVATKRDLNRIMQLRRLDTLSLQGNPISAVQSSRLFLLAMFMHKSRNIQLDGYAASEREQTKIHSYSDRYGSNPDDWPMMQSVITSSDVAGGSSGGSSDPVDGLEESRDHYHKRESKPHPRGLNSPTALEESGTDHWIIRDDSRASSLEASCGVREHRMEVSWQVHAPGEYRGSPISRLSSSLEPSAGQVRASGGADQREGRWSVDGGGMSSNSPQPLMSPSFLANQLHQGRDTFPDESCEEKYAVGNLYSDLSLPSRDDPDGQSETLEVTPPTAGGLTVPAHSNPPSLPITTPPPTPQTANGNYKPHVTPAMIQSALEALQQIEDKQRPLSLMPNETMCTSASAPVPVLSEAVTSALTAWISQKNNTMSTNSTPLVSPPPSTPLDSSTEVPCRPISASDLITALTSLIPPPSNVPDSKGHTSSSVNREKVEDLKGKEASRDDGEWLTSRIRSIDNSNPCTVPSTTPQEGLEEWYKLGIRPEEVIQALSALTIQEPQRVKNEEQATSLSPISEERPAIGVVTVGLQKREEGEGECGREGEGECGREGEGECGGEGERECGREGEGEGEWKEVEAANVADGNSPLSSIALCEGEGRSEGEVGGGRSGEGEGERRGGEIRTSLLSWDPADITEVTITRQITTSDSLLTSIDEEGDSSGLPSDATDSENSVFSPELTHPTSPLVTQLPRREGERGKEGK